MTQDILSLGQRIPNTSLLSSDLMSNMGAELIKLCDQVEQYGLVDYQMGIWEEEILCGNFDPSNNICVRMLMKIWWIYSAGSVP